MIIDKWYYDVTYKLQLCHEFNTFFTQIGPEHARDISQSGVHTVSSFLCDRNKTTLFLKPVNEEEVRTTILSCKGKSSLDVDNIYMLIIHKTMNYITKPLVHIFNLCFERGEFPDKMKISKVLPIFI